MAIFDPKSLRAEEFINDEEIRETIAYAEANKHNIELINSLLEKAAPKRSGNGVTCAGLTHREASVLLACDIPEVTERMYKLANDIKLAFYGNRIVMFAPLYLSNYCVNGCVYCPYHLKNKHIARIKLTQEQVRQEVIALQDMGHKRLAIEAGEDPVHKSRVRRRGERAGRRALHPPRATRGAPALFRRSENRHRHIGQTLHAGRRP